MAWEGMAVTLKTIPKVTGKGLLPARGLTFQCPPTDAFTVAYAHTHTEYDTMAGRQYSRGMTAQLATVSFDTLVIDYATWVLLDDAPTVETYTTTLRDLVNSGDPFWFTASHEGRIGAGSVSLTDFGPEVHMMATLRNLQVSEKAGEGDTRYLNCEFHQYRQAFVQDKKKGKGSVGARDWPQYAYLYGSGRGTESGGAQIVKSGLTLARLAKHYYHDASLAQQIASANGFGTFGSNDDLTKLPRFKKLADSKHVKVKIPAPPSLAWETIGQAGGELAAGIRLGAAVGGAA